MTVTTITGPSKVSLKCTINNQNLDKSNKLFQSSEDVTIHNKYYSPPMEVDESECYSVAESCTLPLLESLEPSPSEIDVNCDEICRSISKTPPLPDLEEIFCTVDITPVFDNGSQVEMVNNEVVTEFTDDGVEERKINPYTLVKKPVIPEVEYKWQRGFRRDSFGKYCKVCTLSTPIFQLILLTA